MPSVRGSATSPIRTHRRRIQESNSASSLKFFKDLSMEFGWGELTDDLLECIVDRLDAHTDILSFRSVCKAWESFVLTNLHRFPHRLPLNRCLPEQCRLPLVMLPFAKGKTTRDFFCISEQKIYGGFLLPESHNKWICGSSHGWLLTIDISGPELHLLNPFTRKRLCLPPSTTISEPKIDTTGIGMGKFHYIRKAILSGNPASNTKDCSVMAIISICCALSFCRLGDNKWTNINGSPTIIEDVIFYKGQYYALNHEGIVVVCDIGPNPKVTAIVGTIERNSLDTDRYLVESSGELLQVLRQRTWHIHGDNIIPKSTRFQVFKLEEKGAKEGEDEEEDNTEYYKNDESEDVYVKNTRYKWVKLKSLGDQMLFLGHNHSMSLSASSFPNCKRNCIYFSDDFMESHVGRQIQGSTELSHDIGIFDLEDGKILPYLSKPVDFNMPPIWVTPAPW